jgi:L-ascorbate metabolism protein UlaG (beta-lactamase superfamily)
MAVGGLGLRASGGRLGLLAGLAATLLAAFAPAAAAAGCAAVASRSLVLPAAFTPAAVPPLHVGLTFLGHASFLIESPAGVTIVTDYNGFLRPPFTPDIVTMNHAHSSHYTDSPNADIKYVLRGWDPGGGVPRHDMTLGDVRIHSVPTNIRAGSEGTEFGGNSIFVFELADLCLAHLGHLHHTLTPEHLADLGPIDVLLAPVDGSYTLSHDDLLEVIDKIRPALVVPMHYFSGRVLDMFLARTEGRYPVRRSAEPSVLLSRAGLPRQTEILVLPGY